MWIDIYKDMWIDMWVDMWIDIYTDMWIDMCVNMCVNMCVDMLHRLGAWRVGAPIITAIPSATTTHASLTEAIVLVPAAATTD